MPKVSIIIPIYNVESYLRECLESVIGQTLKDIEIICVNDGSTDNSPAILAEYAKKDRRIVVVDKKNSGYGHTMNVGLNLAQGEYIGFVESDDYVPPDMYGALYDLAEANAVDFIKADFYRFKEENGALKLDYNDLSHGKKEYYNRVLDPAGNPEIFRFIMNTWSGIYKRSFIEKHHIRHNETPGASYQDNGFFFQTFCLAERVYFVDKPYYMNRRDNPNSSIKNKSKVYCMADEYKYIWEFLNRNPVQKARFKGMYFVKKYHNYLFTYQRVDKQYKKEFLKFFSDEFKASLERWELEKDAFTPKEWEYLKNIMYHPSKFRKEQDSIQLAKKIMPGPLAKFMQKCRKHGVKHAAAAAGKKLFRYGEGK